MGSHPWLAAVGFAIGLTSFATAQSTCEAPCAAPSLSGSPSPAASPGPGDPRSAELKALDAEIDRAALRGDRDAVAAMLDDGMIAVGGYDDVATRDQVLEQIRPPSPGSKSNISAADVTVMISEGAAVVTSKKTRTFEMNGRSSSMQYRETNSYARRGGRWKVTASITTFEDPPYVAPDVSFDLDFDAAASMGDPRAPVVMFEFSDYECPLCRGFAAETFPKVEKDYVRTGRVAVVFRDNPLEVHPRAAASAAAGRCAETLGKRWPMTDKLLHDPVALSDEDFRRYAREIGLDAARFDRCLSDPATAEQVRRGVEEAARLGVRGTPIFLIGVRRPGEKRVRVVRTIRGALPYEVFRTTLDSVIRTRGL